MLTNEDMEYLLRYDRTDIDKSYTAFFFLSTLNYYISGISNDRKVDPYWFSFYPQIENIIGNYRGGVLDKNLTLGLLKEERENSIEYFKKYGIDSRLARHDWKMKFRKIQENVRKTLEFRKRL